MRLGWSAAVDVVSKRMPFLYWGHRRMVRYALGSVSLLRRATRLPDVATLLDRIETTALGGDVVKAMRLCISLGGHAGSAELREWALRELHGYEGVSDLPDYRRIGGGLHVDAINTAWRVTGQRISSMQLPDGIREHLSEEIEMRHSIPALESMVDSAERANESIRLSPPGAAEVAALMNAGGYGSHQVTSLYWVVSASTVRGIIERVCTNVIAMVNEMRAGMGSGEKLPSPELATQAVNIVINGDSNRVVTGDVAQSQGSSSIGKDEGGSFLRKLWWIVGILSMLGGLVFGYIRFMA